MRMTTDLSGSWAIGISGERSIEKMMMMRAKSVLTNVTRDIIKPPAIANAKIGKLDAEGPPIGEQEERRNERIIPILMRINELTVNNL